MATYEKVVNGSIVTYNEFGDAIATRPAPIDMDAVIQTGPFAGWTVQQQAAFWAAQNTPTITPAVATTGEIGANGVVTYDAQSLENEQARLRAIAAADPTVQAALEELKTGAFGIDEEALQAAADAAAAAQLEQDAQDAVEAIIAAGGVFLDTIPRGTTYGDAFIEGMLTTAEYRELYKQIVLDSLAGKIGGVDIDTAVEQGILTREKADEILAQIAAGGVNDPRPVTPASDPVYLVDGKYVDQDGNEVPATVLERRRLGPLAIAADTAASSSSPSRAIAGGFSPWLLAAAGAGLYLLTRR